LETKYSSEMMRAQAEAVVQKKFTTLETLPALTAEDTRAIVHELRVHQVQLELQNDELRSAQLALEESRTRYLDLYDFAPVGYCSMAKNGELIEANLTLSALLGVPRAALIGKPLTRFILCEDQDSFYLFQKQIFSAQLQNHKTTALPHIIELRLRSSDSRVIWVKLVAAEAFNLGHWQLRVVITDISARKQVEIQLGNSERRLRTIIETEPDCVKLTSADGCLLEMNAAGLRLVEADSFQQIKNDSVYFLVDETHRDAFRTLSARVFKGESGFLEFQITGLKGTRRWVETHASPLRDDAGRITALLGITRDITARKLAESSLRLSDVALKNISQGVIITGADQILVWTNAAFASITGYSAAESVGQNCRFLQGLETDPSTIAAIQLALKARTEFNGEILNYRKDGTAFWNDMTITPVFDSNHVVSHYVGVNRDITARKATEDSLRLSAAALKNISQGVLIASADYCIVSLNLAFTTITGYSPDDVIGRNCKFLQGPETDPLTVAAIRFALENRSKFDGEILNYRKDGTAFWNDLTITPVFDSNHVVSHYVGVTRDVTERKLAESSMRLSDVALKSISQGVFITNADQRIVWTNAAFKATTGYSAEESMGRNCKFFQGPETDSQSVIAIQKAVKNHAEFNGEILNYRKDGTAFWDDLTITPVFDVQGAVSHYIGITRDITERRLAEAAIQKQLHELQRWQEAMLGREDRIMELKREVNELLARQNQPPRYASPDAL